MAVIQRLLKAGEKVLVNPVVSVEEKNKIPLRLLQRAITRRADAAIRLTDNVNILLVAKLLQQRGGAVGAAVINHYHFIIVAGLL